MYCLYSMYVYVVYGMSRKHVFCKLNSIIGSKYYNTGGNSRTHYYEALKSYDFGLNVAP